ncbi:MAG: hypothetical protein FWF88_11450 [Peptococcaceae bacterium]|nr:hypothetical protein [Peptococcaceae bacterium]
MKKRGWLERYLVLVAVFYILTLMRISYDAVIVFAGIGLLILGIVAAILDKRKRI